MNYYNEFNLHAAAWLQGLIDENLIPPGHVDARSITEISPSDLHGYTQCHFFAGIGGWPLALQLAGVPSTRSLWSGSCPCQPFSVAGEGKGIEDERHLWPVFFNLIRACNPPIVFGEQVASAAVLGSSAKPTKRSAGKAVQPVWLDGVFADLESAGYACGSSDIPAAGVGAPHIRQRCWWGAVRLADTECEGLERRIGAERDEQRRSDKLAHSIFLLTGRPTPRAEFVREVSGWPSPGASDMVNANETPEQFAAREVAMKAKNPNLGGLHKKLPIVAQLTGWPSPVASEARQGYQDRTNGKKGTQESLTTLTAQSSVAGWATPITNDALGSQYCYGPKKPDGTRAVFLKLPGEAQLAHGEIPTGTPAEMANTEGFQLNPFFSMWLMSFPVEWTLAGILALKKFRSLQKPPKASRSPARKPSKSSPEALSDPDC